MTRLSPAAHARAGRLGRQAVTERIPPSESDTTSGAVGWTVIAAVLVGIMIGLVLVGAMFGPLVR